MILTRVRPDFVLTPFTTIDVTQAAHIIPFSLNDFDDGDDDAVSRSSPR